MSTSESLGPVCNAGDRSSSPADSGQIRHPFSSWFVPTGSELRGEQNPHVNLAKKRWRIKGGGGLRRRWLFERRTDRSGNGSGKFS